MKYHHAIIAGRIIATKPRYCDEIPPSDIPMLLSVLRTLWLEDNTMAPPDNTLDTMIAHETITLHTQYPTLGEEDLHHLAILRVEQRLRASQTIINERNPQPKAPPHVVPPSPRPGD